MAQEDEFGMARDEELKLVEQDDMVIAEEAGLDALREGEPESESEQADELQLSKKDLKKKAITKKEIDDFLKKCHVFFVATVDEEGNPRVRPFGAHLLVDDEIWFMTQRKGNKVYGQMLAHPRIEICGYSEKFWIRLTGDVEFCDDRELAKKFIEAAPMGAKKIFQNGLVLSLVSKNTMPFRLKNMACSYNRFFKNGNDMSIE